MEEKNGFLFNLKINEIVEDTKDPWPRLLNEINNGNVIPVIGPDLLVEPKIIEGDERRIENLHQQIISFIAQQTNVKSKPRTFSQLVYDKDYLENQVNDKGEKIDLKIKDKLKSTYRVINQILDNLDKIPSINHIPSKLLMDLLGTRKFPFVITTSFTPIVEQAMKQVWGEVKVFNFTNNPQASLSESGGDIKSEEELKRPTVLYMLGKYCNNPEKFVVTDSDMMIYCGSWIKGYAVPTNLTKALNKKYLLILGNNYSDWLYRFVWFSLRTTPKEMRTDVVVNEDAEDTFVQFLKRLETFYQEDPTLVIKRIKDEMNARSNTTLPPTTPDVFISYSRRDENIAWNLYNSLKDKNITVWFDRMIIKTGNWDNAIKEGIRHSRLFVPVLTKNVQQEVMDVHEYRGEWNLASELSEKMGARTFIIPFAEQEFDFDNPLIKLPNEFKKMNAIWFSDENDVQEVTNIIIQELNKLYDMKNKLKI